MVKERDRKIDILRFIAIVCIILAHSGGTPPVIFQLRNFDVVLMVLLLGVSFYMSNKNRTSIDYKDYLIKRFKRLVVPTWVFLSIFFVLFFIVSLVAGHDYYFDLSTILMSYALTEGIGYIWIMKVFFAVAIISPFLFYLSKKIESNFKYVGTLIGFYIIYSLLVLWHNNFSDNAQMIFENVILHGFGYGIVAAIGTRLLQFKRREIIVGCALFFLTFVGLMVWNDFEPTQISKYPPTIYYFSYGLFVSLFLYLVLDIAFIRNIFSNKYVYFLSENSLWLYFWHIIPIYIINIFGEHLSLVNYNFLTRFIFLFVVALILTLLQYYFTQRTTTKVNKEFTHSS